MLTASALTSTKPGPWPRAHVGLRRAGWTDAAIRAQLDARRWQRFGRVVVCHGGPLSRSDRRAVALLNCGSRAVLTAFSAAEHVGLEGWERDDTHVLVPAGARVRRTAVAPVVVHYTGDWTTVASVPGRRLHRCAPALVLAATSFASARSACGVLAAGVQQRLVTAEQLRAAIAAAPRARHHRVMAAAVEDIAQGAHSLSEIDFGRLCRRHGLPEPTRQSVRVEPSGVRRYLDVEWSLPNGRRVVVEVDGAMHMAVERWTDDQLRHNEVAIPRDVTVLRYPSVVIRTEPQVVVDQLRRALIL